MTIVTHILTTTIGAEVLHLSGLNLFWAYCFGVLVDLDHLIKIPLYFKKHNFNLVKLTKARIPNEKYYHWRTLLQEPVALLWILPFCFFINSFVPFYFFMLHLFFDYFVSYKKLPFYPFSNFSTKGFLAHMPDELKETVTIIATICILIILIAG